MSDRITSAVLLTKTNEVLGQMRFDPGVPTAIPVEKDGHCWRALIKWASGQETNFRIDRVIHKGDSIDFVKSEGQ
jgi:hypothetical protein